MVKTLRQFIADRDYEDPRYTNLEWHGGDYDLINQTLYGSADSDWGQFDRFMKNEKLMCYELEKWRCTDTYVGLNLITLNGQPSAITWQNARKSDNHMLFISEEARSAFIEKWELYSDEPEQDNLMSDALLDTPYGINGNYIYGLDHQSDHPQGSYEAVEHILEMVMAGDKVESSIIKHAVKLTEQYLNHRKVFIDELLTIKERDNLHDGQIDDAREERRRDYLNQTVRKFQTEYNEIRENVLATLTEALNQEQNLSL